MEETNANNSIYDQLAERGIILPRPKPDRMSEEMQSCKLSDEELLDIGRRLARTTDQKRQAESDKSQVVKQYAARIAGCDTEIGDLSQKLSNGYEWRKVECATYFDHPRKGMATTFRLDTGEEIATRRMTYDELQTSLELTPPAEPAANDEDTADAIIDDAEASASEDLPIRLLQYNKRGAYVDLKIYADDDGGFAWDAQIGPGTVDDASRIETISGGYVEDGATVEAAVIAACETIEHHARSRAKETDGREKSAWALILSWAIDTAGETRRAAGLEENEDSAA